MNKAALISGMADKAHLTKKQSEDALNAFLEVVKEQLKNGEKVQIVGFGTFEMRIREEHSARNPSTGEMITVKATQSPVFKPGKTFKEEFK
ncbi:MAG: HU family DNA-binding protein [Clostridia bacterium]|nr:HU family DNA-binding protein [Clostridia bacterium]MBQ4156850.1 HU family DNA-binding protein [Clostridia bacterium]